MSELRIYRVTKLHGDGIEAMPQYWFPDCGVRLVNTGDENTLAVHCYDPSREGIPISQARLAQVNAGPPYEEIVDDHPCADCAVKRISLEELASILAIHRYSP